MKTVFIINPKSGKKKRTEKFLARIQEKLKSESADTEIYVTKSIKDAENFVRSYCKEYGAARFIACGGDGTLNEVVNGVSECPEAQIGVIPIGSGNDFCRNFKDNTDFFDIHSQIYSDTVKCDAIRCSSINSSGEKTSYFSINMLNIGFDCNVAAKAAELKKMPFISGSFAYFLAVFIILVKKAGEDIAVFLDGEQKHFGKLLLTSVASGCYCGGGIKSNPLADVNNGRINVNIIYNISRFEFLKKLPFYMRGTHIKLKGIEKFILSENCKKVDIIPQKEYMKISCDGEIRAVGKTEFEIVPKMLNFVVPKK